MADDDGAGAGVDQDWVQVILAAGRGDLVEVNRQIKALPGGKTFLKTRRGWYMLNLAAALAANKGIMQVSDYLRLMHGDLTLDPAVLEHGLVDPYLTCLDTVPTIGRWAVVTESLVREVAADPALLDRLFMPSKKKEAEEEEEAKAADEKAENAEWNLTALLPRLLKGVGCYEELTTTAQAIEEGIRVAGMEELGAAGVARADEMIEKARKGLSEIREKRRLITRAAEEKAKEKAKLAEAKAKVAELSLLADLEAEDAKAAKKKDSNKKKKEKKKEKAKGKGKGKGEEEQQQQEEEAGSGVAALAGGMGGLAVAHEGKGEEEVDGDRKLPATVPASAPQEGKKGEEEEQEEEEEEEEEDEEEFMLAGAPNEYVCPISLTLMTDPVFCSGDGHTYERAAIEEWIAKCVTKQQPISSPRTGEVMEGTLTANKMARALIRDYVDRRQGEWVQRQEEKKKLKKKEGQQQQQKL